MTLNVDHLLRTAATLEQAVLAVQSTPDSDDMCDLYRKAALRSFGLSLETADRLLRKALKACGGSPRSVDDLVCNDVLRHAGKHGLLDQEGVERWLHYRVHNIAHDHGVNLANETLTLLPAYLSDMRALAIRLQEVLDPAAGRSGLAGTAGQPQA